MDEVVEGVVHGARERDIPVVHALTRRQLAKVLHRPRCRIGAVAVVDADGANAAFKRMLAWGTSGEGGGGGTCKQREGGRERGKE